jgi:hypothetical protein
MEAFSDSVLAIIITIMALEVEAPRGVELTALWPLVPAFLSHGLSFIYLGIYWSNHHHMLYLTHGVNAVGHGGQVGACGFRHLTDRSRPANVTNPGETLMRLKIMNLYVKPPSL